METPAQLKGFARGFANAALEMKVSVFFLYIYRKERVEVRNSWVMVKRQRMIKAASARKLITYEPRVNSYKPWKSTRAGYYNDREWWKGVGGFFLYKTQLSPLGLLSSILRVNLERRSDEAIPMELCGQIKRPAYLQSIYGSKMEQKKRLRGSLSSAQKVP